MRQQEISGMLMRRLKNATWLVLLAGVCSFTSQVAVASGEFVDESRRAEVDGFVSINVMRGQVEIIGWDEPRVHVKGHLDEDTERFDFESSGNETRIHVKVRDRNSSSWFSDYASDLTIHVPAGSQVEMGGVSTDVEARKLTGGVEIHVVSGKLRVDGGVSRIDLQTVSGDVVLRNSTGRVKVKTVSGNVETYDTVGDATYSSVSGDIYVEDGGKDLRLESVSGDIEVQTGTLSTVGGHSVSGDIEIDGTPGERAAIEFDTISGSIRLNLAGDVNARFDIETGSGSIRNRLSDHKPKVSKFMQEETLRFSLGQGDGQVTLTTRSGDISIGGR